MIPSWLQDVDLAGFAMVAASLVFIGWVIVKLWKPARAVVLFFDKLIGDPEKDRPGLWERLDLQDEELTKLKARIGEIHHEVHHNNGSSIKDSQARTEAAVKRIEATQRAIKATQDSDLKALSQHLIIAEQDRHRIDHVAEMVEDMSKKIGDEDDG